MICCVRAEGCDGEIVKSLSKLKLGLRRSFGGGSHVGLGVGNT